MEWLSVTERTQCVSVCESLITVYHLGEGKVVLIDAGGGVDMEFMEELEARKLEVRGILCTHLHFDHISMAGYVYDRFHMPSYASVFEEKEEKFPTREFPVTPISGSEPVIIDGVSFEVLPLPGHTKGHLGFVTPDGVCCVGDAFISIGPLRTAKIPYMVNVEQAIQSMELIRQRDCRACVLAHEAVIWPEELSAVIDANIDEELRLYELIKEYVTMPMPVEEMITGFMKLCGIRSKFILGDEGYRDTVRSRLISLEYAGELRLEGSWVMPASK